MFCRSAKTTLILFTCIFGLKCLASRPSIFSKYQKYPNKDETEVCGNIRDIIDRDSGRYKKILVRNTNSEVVFNNEDCRRMTSRTKSKLDVLASRVRGRWNGVYLKVILAWTDQTFDNPHRSLHYEGRAVRLQTSDGDQSKLGELAGLAAQSGFDWVHYASDSYIHGSVIRDVCQTAVDLAFILDDSGSVGEWNFVKVKTFVKNVVDFFNIGVHETHVAAITFSSSTRVVFNLNSYYSKSKIKTAINGIVYGNGWATRTANALDDTRKLIFSTARPDSQGVPKVAVLLTDGLSNGRAIKGPARDLRERGVNVFSVGVGRASVSELNEIASDPDSTHVFHVSSFDDISGWVDKISSVSCDEGAVVSSCDDTITTVDSGSFKYFRTSFSVVNNKISIEVEDKEGISHLFASTTSSNPGPLDDNSKKNESNLSPRSLSIATDANKLIYVAVQGQGSVNRFKLSMWDALFSSDHYTLKIAENKPKGSMFDVQSSYHGKYSLKYSFVSGNAQVPFIINSDTGFITVTETLDRETTASYRLTVLAVNTQNRCHKGRTRVTIIVNDENDNKPIFQPKIYNVTIKENNPPKAFVVKVTATDADSGNNGKLSFNISNGNQDGHFTIDEQGRIYTNRSLDYETKSSYTLTVEAADHGSPERKTNYATVNVAVEDVYEHVISDTCPTLQPKEYNMTLTENVPYQTFVTQVFASYKTKNDTIQYAIQDGNTGGAFIIDSQSGVISVSNAGLDREATAEFRLLVRAGPESCGVNQSCSGSGIEDQGCKDVNLPALGVVNIKILDKNDNPPKFIGAPYEWRNIDTSTMVLPPLQATDSDLGEGGKVKFRLGGERQDGNVRYLTVVAYDLGKPSLESNTTIKLEPRQSCEAMSFTVSEDGQVNASTLCSFDKFSGAPQTLTLGKSLEMECSAKGNMKARYRWMLNGRFQSDWSDEGQYSVSKVSQDHEGLYYCLASSPAGVIQSGSAKVTVYEIPRITKQPENTTARAGGEDTAILECSGTGDPKVKYQWYKNENKLLKDENIIDPTNDTLTIRAIEKKYHSGFYHCTVSNIMGTARSRDVLITVYDAESEVKLTINVNRPGDDGKCQVFNLGEFKEFLSTVLNLEAFFRQVKVNQSLLCKPDPCQSNPCKNNGKCQKQTGAGFTCLCGVGWTGDKCQIDRDECLIAPCLNGGVCVNNNGSYSCNCVSNKTGRNCELMADVCQPSPCGGDLCIPSEYETKGYQCATKDQLIIMESNEIGKGKSTFDLEKEIEELIKRARQPGTTVTIRRRRNVGNTVDYGACRVRIIERKETKVQFVLACPSDMKLDPVQTKKFVCNLLFASKLTSSCGNINGMTSPQPPTTATPMKPLGIELVMFAKDKDGNDVKAEALVNKIKEEGTIGQLKKKMNVDVMEAKVKQKPKAKTQTGLSAGAIVGIVAAVVLILVVVAVVVITHKRRKDMNSHVRLSKRAQMNSRERIADDQEGRNYMNKAYNEENQDNFMVKVELGPKKTKGK